MPKYTIVNGKPVIATSVTQATPSQPTTAMTIVSTMAEQAEIAELTNLGVPQQFQDTIAKIQTPAYLAGFQTNNIDGDMIIEGLMKVFEQNQIPIGLMTKLAPLQGATLHFKIDDSSSMTNYSNLHINDACVYTKQKLAKTGVRYLSRWQEAEDRMHTLVELLAYVPTGPIILSFFDRGYTSGQRLVLDRRGKMPVQFLQDAHAAIDGLFSKRPSGDTPIWRNMKNMFDEANRNRSGSDTRTMHYLLTDGEPNDGAEEVRWIKDLLISNSRNAVVNPFTFLGCSNLRADYAWMHELEEVAPFVAALPDFRDELAEVNRDQGFYFPYSRGFWLLCNIAAAINPDDLDALDQHAPITKQILENLMGRGITEDEYLGYYNQHPNASRVFGPDYQFFLTTLNARDIPAVKIFQSVLAQRLKQDIDEDNDDTEQLDIRIAEQAVFNWRRDGISQFQGGLFAARRGDYSPSYDRDRSCNCVLL